MSARVLEGLLGAGICLAALGVFIWGLPLWVEANDFVVVSPDLMPRVAVGAIAVFGGMMAVHRLVLDRGEGALPEANLRMLGFGAALVTIFGLACAAMLTLGYLAGGVALVAALMLFMGERRWWMIAAIAAAAPLVLHGFFDRLLGVPLP